VVLDYDNDYSNYGVFEHFFLTQALGHLVVDLGLTGASNQGLQFAQYVGKFIAGVMGATGEFYWPFAASDRYRVSAILRTPMFIRASPARTPTVIAALRGALVPVAPGTIGNIRARLPP